MNTYLNVKSIVRGIGVLLIAIGLMNYAGGIIYTVRQVIMGNEVTMIRAFFLSLIYLALYLSSGVGILFYKRWGWYLGMVNLVFVIVRYLVWWSVLALLNQRMGMSGIDQVFPMILESLIPFLFTLVAIKFLIRKDVLGIFEIKVKPLMVMAFSIGGSIVFLLVRDFADITHILQS